MSDYQDILDDIMIKVIKIVIGRCVRKEEPIICTGLCNTLSCPFPYWMAMGLNKPLDEKIDDE